MSDHDLIDFYFDFSSPYGYFAAAKLDEVVAPYDREVKWHPILLGPIFKETNSKPLMDYPLKSDYITYDWERLARFMDLPWKLPEDFPIVTAKAARAFYVIEDQYGSDKAKSYAKSVYKAYFGDNQNINDTGVLSTVIGVIEGIDSSVVLAEIKTADVKARLKSEVDIAIQKGVIGSPFVIVDGEKFWGADRFWMIKRWLKFGGW